MVFYAYNQPVLVFLLLVSAGINIITTYYVVYGHLKYKKVFAVLGVVLNLSLLIFFKYSPLLSRTFLLAQSSLGQFLLTIPLPIGISFFTFQGVSLVVDCFLGKNMNCRDVIKKSFCEHAQNVLFFKSFFPQLISGPIVKAHHFLPQIGHKKFLDIPWEKSFKNLVTGYFLKMVVADNLKDFTFWI
ncbi:MAG: MBOAT family protein, partial [Candidatus Omnitrophica bacterium]|nr:MBOAT family protein [Candidatus Omnitrophota bacterium]